MRNVPAGLSALVAQMTETQAGLRTALLLMLDHVDYTKGACGLGEPVGGCLPKSVLEMAHRALAPP